MDSIKVSELKLVHFCEKYSTYEVNIYTFYNLYFVLYFLHSVHMDPVLYISKYCIGIYTVSVYCYTDAVNA